MIYDYTVTTGKGEQLALADYKGKVIMVVNTATGCGFTPQCEAHCPQGIKIREKLKEADKALRPLPYKVGINIVRRFMFRKARSAS